MTRMWITSFQFSWNGLNWLQENGYVQGAKMTPCATILYSNNRQDVALLGGLDNTSRECKEGRFDTRNGYLQVLLYYMFNPKFKSEERTKQSTK